MNSAETERADAFLRYRPFSDPRAQVLLSLRASGDMSAPEGKARLSFFRSAGVDPDHVFSLAQVHSRRVVRLKGGETPGELRGIEADGLVSPDRRTTLGVTVADCVPVFLFEPESGLFAALHSGWKGTGIVLEALAEMEKAGARVPGTEAFIGPSIGPCCYRVDRERAELFAKLYGEETVVWKEGAGFLDLRRANERLLREAGVTRITADRSCTCCDARFGSFRRQGEGGFDRMLALISFFD